MFRLRKTVACVIATYCRLYPGMSGRVYDIAADALAELPKTATEEDRAKTVERWLLAEL